MHYLGCQTCLDALATSKVTEAPLALCEQGTHLVALANDQKRPGCHSCERLLALVTCPACESRLCSDCYGDAPECGACR